MGMVDGSESRDTLDGDTPFILRNGAKIYHSLRCARLNFQLAKESSYSRRLV
jgi:hypothetical protein